MKETKKTELAWDPSLSSVALGLDFSPDREAILREYHPIEIAQIGKGSEDFVVHEIKVQTLYELAEKIRTFSRIVILTRRTQIVEKFLTDNGLDAELYPWKLGGESFVLENKKEKTMLVVITDEVL